MLIRIILLALAVWLIFVLLRQYRRSMDAPSAPPPVSQDMVCCAVCGVHLPKNESVEKHGAYYCEEHGSSADQ